MNWNRLALVEGPATDALTLAAAKAHLQLDGVSGHDDNVTAFLKSAIAQLDGPEGIGVALITQTWRLSLDRWPYARGRSAIQIPLRPVQTVDAITYVDPDGVTQTLAADQYAYDLDCRPLVIYPAQGVSWPSLKCDTPGVVKVEFTAGFGDTAADVPADLTGAMKLIVGHAFRNRSPDAVEATLASEWPLGVEPVLRRHGGYRVA